MRICTSSNITSCFIPDIFIIYRIISVVNIIFLYCCPVCNGRIGFYPLGGVPFQTCPGAVQSLGFYPQAVESQFQTVFDFAGLGPVIGVVFINVFSSLAFSSQDATLVSSIIRSCLHIGIVTTAHNFVIDNNGGIKQHGVLVRIGHTAHITTTVQGSYI